MEIRFNTARDILQVPQVSIWVQKFDMLMGPNIYQYVTEDDCREIYKLSTSLKLSSKAVYKRQLIGEIMERRGFKKICAGTNRVIYRHLEDPTFVAKVATDVVSLNDNINEYKNQMLLKPFVAKTFSTHPTGAIAFQERLKPILRAKEFELIAEDVFDIIVHNFIGKFVLEDIGTDFFMNWGIREGFGPALLDYPYCYELDGNKLYCNNKDMGTGEVCNGVLDYDAGFNHIICPVCNKRYPARELKSNIKQNKVIIKGGLNPMKITIKNGDGNVIYRSSKTSDIIMPRNVIDHKKKEPQKTIKVHLNNVEGFEEKKIPEVEEETLPAEPVEEKEAHINVDEDPEDEDIDEEEDCDEDDVEEDYPNPLAEEF